jgi:uncharacterized protein YbcC (UPF0753/DUF2309 family)
MAAADLFDVASVVRRIALHLPGQAPVARFVARNHLSGDQHLPFVDAVRASHDRRGAWGFPDEQTMRRHLRVGRIDGDDLRETLAERLGDARHQHVAPLRDAPTVLECALVALEHDVDPVDPERVRWELANGLARALSPHLDDRERARLQRGRGDEVTARTLWEAVCAALRVPSTFPHPEDALSDARHHHDAGTGAFRDLVDAARAATVDAVGRSGTHVDAWARVTGVDLDAIVHDLLIRRVASFVDEGVADLPPPGRGEGFYAWFRRVEPLDVGRDTARYGDLPAVLRALPEDPDDAVRAALARLGVPLDQRADDLERTALRLPGWAGLAGWHDANPKYPGHHLRRYDLVSFLAVRLAIEVAAIERVAARLGLPPSVDALAGWTREHPEALVVRCALSRGELPPSLEDDARALVRHDSRYTPAWREIASAVVAWRVALGGARTVHRDARPLFLAAQHLGLDAEAITRLGEDGAVAIVDMLRAWGPLARGPVWLEAYERHYRDQFLNGLSGNRGRTTGPVDRPSAQLVACMDDREEGLRRHLEEVDPDVETFGAAGFFGVAMRYLGLGDAVPTLLCPIVQDPPFLVAEVATGPIVPPTTADRIRAWIGVRPPIRTATRLDFVAPAPDPDRSPERPQRGFTDDEQADRVAGFLKQIGLVRGFARVFALLGHGGTTRNNPHAAAYECGACSGRRGGPNARLFAAMANRPAVRERLAARGIQVDDDVWFLGGEHDTTSESVTFYDLDDVPESHRADVDALRLALDEAVARSAQERARKFASAPLDPEPSVALAHSRERSTDVRQARSELGHATNASAVVGRRALTRGLYLDRRSFLISYDPSLDPEGSVLEGILMAAAPVGAGINLEYYFAAVDPERYGSGSKVGHNVTGLVGVMAGGRGDLRPGLPRQNVEIHEPMRLLLVVEATTAVLAGIHARQAPIRELLDGEWVQLVAIDPTSGAASRFRPGVGFVPWSRPEMHPSPQVLASPDAYRGRGDTPIDPVLVGAEVAHG